MESDYMVGSSEEWRAYVELSMKKHLTTDTRPVRERLLDYAMRGTEAPETLSPSEIKQIAFALSLYLSLDEKG